MESFKTTLITKLTTGTPAIWETDGVHVEIHDANRDHHTWPQADAKIVITTPDGETTRISGAAITSWTDLWTHVENERQVWEYAVTDVLHTLDVHQHELDEAEQAATVARTARNTAIRSAAAKGLSAYRIAKQLKIAESTVGRILKAANG